MGGTTALGGGSQTVNLTPKAGGGVTATLTAGTAGATSVPLEVSVSSGTLIDWDLDKSEDGGATWSTVEAGITTTTKTASNLNPATSVQFRGTARVEVEAVGTVTVTTAESSPIPLTQWTQIEGGQQFGGAYTGGEQWWWNEQTDGTFYATLYNQEADPIIAAQAIIEGAGDVAPMVGWGIKSGDHWDTDATSYQPPAGGSVASPKIVASAELPLTYPIAVNGFSVYQEVRAPGTIVPATSLSGNSFPETSIVSSDNFLKGNHLGEDSESGFPGLGPVASRVYLKKSGDPLYVFAVVGDSTTVPVRPLSAANQLGREGYHFRANQKFRSTGKRVRIYSYGQGAAGWVDIQARARAILPHVSAGKASRMAVQVWTWNSAHTTAEQAEYAWQEYLALEAEILAAGIGCSPLILNPYTNRNDPGQIAAFNVIKAYAQAHPFGIVLDEIMGGTSWPDLPASESEDDVHQNADGAIRTGPLAADVFLSVAAIDYPELA